MGKQEVPADLHCFLSGGVFLALDPDLKSGSGRVH